MPAPHTTLGVAVLLLIAIFRQQAEAQVVDAAAADSPRAVVTRWLELHAAGKRDEAAALTTGARYHRAHQLLPSTRVTGVRVEPSLGNERAAAVITSSLAGTNGGSRVLLFWLVRSDGVWRINKSDSAERSVVEERLRGFLEAGDVRWHVEQRDLLGDWEAGPCRPPGGGGIACGHRLHLSADNRYRLVAWGPAGPCPDGDGDDVRQGAWRLTKGRILLSHQGRVHPCHVTWMTDDLLVIESLDGKVYAEYQRSAATEEGPVAGCKSQASGG